MAFDLRRLLGLEAPAHPAAKPQTKVPYNNGFYSGSHQDAPVQPNAHPANLGVGYADAPQMQTFNPGFTPLQNSGFGPQGNPQIGAFNSPFSGQNLVNPQDDENQQYWF